MLSSLLKRNIQFQARNAYSTLVSYGCNDYGQAGSSSFDVILFDPQEIKFSDQPDITSIAAGAHHSAIVTASGDVYTFGASQNGQLGLGSTQPAYLPTRVESLSNRSFVKSSTLGANHTFFLDDQGIAYASGTASPPPPLPNRLQGAMSPLSSFVFMNRSASSTTRASTAGTADSSMSAATTPPTTTAATQPTNSVMTAPTIAAAAAPTTTHSNLFDLSSFGHHHHNNHIQFIKQQQSFSLDQTHSQQWSSLPLHSALEHAEREMNIQDARSMYDRALRNALLETSAYVRYQSSTLYPSGDRNGGNSLFHFDAYSAHGFGVPKKVGLSMHSSSSETAKPSHVDSFFITPPPPPPPTTTTTAMLHHPLPALKKIASCVASSSTVVLSAQDIYPHVLSAVPGAPHHGTVEQEPYHAHQQHLLTPCPLLMKLSKDHGGVVDVTAGEEYYAALCASGTVLVWWTTTTALTRLHPPKTLPIQVQSMAVKGSACSTGNTVSAGKPSSDFTGQCRLPMTLHTHQDGVTADTQAHTHILEIRKSSSTTMPFVHVQASPDKLLVSDGTKVWLLDVRIAITAINKANRDRGGHLNNSAGQCVVHVDALLDIGDDSVKSLACGATSYAIVTSEKRLWFWGSLLSDDDVALKLDDREKEGYGHWSYSSSRSSSARSMKGGLWCGLRSLEPVIVPGLHGVERIALGKNHAIVQVA